MPASSTFIPVMMSVVRSSVVSMWNRPPAVTWMSRPSLDHSMFLAFPEKAQAMVRTLPGSMLMSSGRASILGAEPGDGQDISEKEQRGGDTEMTTNVRSLPMALKEDSSMWDVISVRLLELMAYVSEVMEDRLDMDMVSNFISAALLLKELDSIMDDIIACWAREEEKEDDPSSMWTSFFIIMDELMDDDEDSL